MSALANAEDLAEREVVRHADHEGAPLSQQREGRVGAPTLPEELTEGDHLVLQVPLLHRVCARVARTPLERARAGPAPKGEAGQRGVGTGGQRGVGAGGQRAGAGGQRAGAGGQRARAGGQGPEGQQPRA